MAENGNGFQRRHQSRSPRRKKYEIRAKNNEENYNNDQRRHASINRRRRRQRRSVTLSPCPIRIEGQTAERRNSDFDWSTDYRLHPITPTRLELRSFSPISPGTGTPSGSNGVQKRPELPHFARRGRLRKTSSMPTDVSMDELGEQQDKVNAIQDILNSLNFSKFHVRPSSPPSDDLVSFSADAWGTASEDSPDSDVIVTDIEELKGAAKSIEALSRKKLLAPIQTGLQKSSSGSRSIPALSVSSVPDVPSSVASSSDMRKSGITTRLGGHPRGVMQFLPSVNSSSLLSKTAYESYMACKSRREQRPNDSSLNNNKNYDNEQSSTTYVQQYEPAPPNAITIDSSNYFVGQDRPDIHMRRKVSVPDRFYKYEIMRPSPPSFLVVPPQANVSDSVENDYLGNLYSDEIAALVSPVSRKPPANPDRYNRRLSRFASFGTPGTTKSQRQTPVLRQLSAREKPLSDIDDAYTNRIKGAESLAGFSRFGRLLRSLRASRQNSPDTDIALSPASSDSPLSSPITQRRLNSIGGVQKSLSWQRSAAFLGPPTPDTELFGADVLLWRKRSRGSLRRHEDTRTHIVRELFDTEDNYVHSLRLMVKNYVRPLKRPELCPLIESSLVDEIFFQIPEILGHHELFHAALKSRLDNWDSRQKIGDIILNNFTKQCVIDTYTAFINNWKNAKQAIRTACHTKPAFAKYLERCAREHHNKLTLDALLIMPVQRIPRYELLIKELLKHTSVEHPDHSLLLRAQKEIHELATKINHVEQEAGLCEQMLQRLRELEAIVDGLDDIVANDRIFYRYDMVAVVSHGQKKERCIFLLSDLVLITGVKRKSSAALKKSSLASPPPHDLLENHKFKLLMKISLDDLDVAKNTLPLLNKIQEEVNQLQEDVRVLNKISELTALLKFPHDEVEDDVDSMKEKIRTQLAGKQQEMCSDPVLTSLDLLVTTEEGIETFTITFHNAERRAGWEKCFKEAKQTLESSLTKKPPPVFVKSVPIQKNRAGLHLSCASHTIGKNDNGYPNVWVCSSDNYVGQMATVNLTPEPDIESCNGISNSKIICICPVPVAKGSMQKRKRVPPATVLNLPKHSNVSKATTNSIVTTSLELDSESSDNDDSTTADLSGASKSSKNSSTERSRKWKEEIVPNETNRFEDEEQIPTMWLGTEDGGILVYNYNDSIRTKKCRLSAQHNSTVTAMIYVEDRVYVSLGSGEVIVYERSAQYGWDWDLKEYKKFPFNTPIGASISCMITVPSRLWCSCRNNIHILNHHKWQHESSFQVNSDDDSHVACMAGSGLGVWLTIQGSPVIKLHHVMTYECILEVNVSPIVTKTLAGCDDIIRQHKLACLRVTALMCCKDSLWIGTSAGVILNFPLPHLSHNSTRLVTSPSISVCPTGHCGQCRFLINVDLHGSMSRSGSFSTQNPADYNRRRMSLNVATLHQGKIYIISGGDGFEDFQDMSTDEGDDSTGRQDSTNHLLFWHV